MPPRPPPPSPTSSPPRPSSPISKPGCCPTPTGSRSLPSPGRPRPRTGTPTPPGPPGPPRTGRCGSPPAWRPTASPAPPWPRAGSRSSRPRSSCARLADLPDDLDPEITAKAERLLLAYADHHDAKTLRHLGRHILEVASPEAADAHQAALLEREERDAAAATRLTMYDDGHGKVHGRFTLDTLTGAMLKKALFAIAAPRHQASKGPLGAVGPSARSARPGSAGPRQNASATRSPTTSSATRQNAPQDRRPQRHRRGPHRPRHPDGRAQSSPPRHRRTPLTRRRPPAGLRSRDHPRRPRRQLPGPRPGPQETLLHRRPTHRQDHRSRRLRSRGLRLAHPG